METTRYTDSGIPYKVIKEVQGSPLSQLLKIGRDMQIREMLEKQQNKKLTYAQELEIRKRKDEILRKMEEDFGPNSKLRGNKDEDNKHKK